MTSNPYEWTQDPMLNDMADENPSIANEDFNYLKYETDDLRNYGVPFSVNSGTRNASGYADFIAKVSNTEISFSKFLFDSGTLYGGNTPYGITVSGSTVYVVDDGNDKVYKSVDSGATWDSGTLYGGSNPYGIAVSGSTVYVVDNGTHRVYKSVDSGATWDSGTLYGGSNPYGIAVSGSTVYVVDNGTHRVYKSVDSGATWDSGTLYGGTGYPAIAVSGSTVYVVDNTSNKVYKSVDSGATWDSGTLYGGSYPTGIAVSGSTVYVVDNGTHRVYKSVDSGATRDSGTLYGGSYPTGIAVSGSTVYVVDAGADKVYKSVDNSSLVLTYPDGTRETHDSLPNITGISADGTYTVILEKGTGTPIATTSAVTESWGLPSSATNGDYVCDISIKPLQTYKRVNGIWYPTQYVKLGEFTRTSGTIATPVSYAFNGKYISTDTACVTTTNTTTTFTHNLSTQFYKATLYLRCITAELGYTVGQVIPAMVALTTTTPFYVVPYIGANNKNSVVFRSGTLVTGLYPAQSQTTGGETNLTPANWKQFVILERTF